MKKGEGLRFYQNKVHCVDCRQGFKELKDQSVDCVWTDPPYNINYKYKNYKDSLKDWDYWGLIHQTLAESYRVLKPGKCMFIKQFWKNINRTLTRAISVGFEIHNIIIWKNSSPAQPKNNYKPIYEVIIMLVKGELDYFNDKFETRTTIIPWNKDRKLNYYGKITNLWDDIPPVYAGSIKHKEAVLEPGTNKKAHPAQHPIKLVTRCIGFVTKPGDLVLDPFIGSGTTAVACKELGRNFVGFEIDEAYCKIAEKRLEQQTLIM